MNINDWKIIQLRNDVKHIKRNATASKAAHWSLVVDVFLVLLAFVLNRIYGNEPVGNTLWIVIAVCGVAIPIVFLIFETVKAKRTEKIFSRVLNTRDLVAMFDDEICYMIMSAEAFNKKLNKSGKDVSRQTALLLEFYVIEAEYYLNKAVYLLLKMETNLTGVLDEKDPTRNHISKERLVNAISLMSSLYNDLFNFYKERSDALKDSSVNLNLREAKVCYESLKGFVKRRKNIIGISEESLKEIVRVNE